MNNLGVDFLFHGRDGEALEQFQGALELMKYKSQGYQFVPLEDERVSRSHSALMRYYRESLNGCSIGEGCAVRDYTLFSKAARIEKRLLFLEDTIGSHNFHHLMSATILFNIALSFHLQPDGKGLRQSESLYRMSYDILSRIQSNLFGAPPAIILATRLVIADLNNLTHLNYTLGRKNLAHGLGAELSSFVSSLPQSSTTMHGTTLWEESNRAVLNSFLMSKPSASSAGAA